jgi:hypothetical protein
MVEHNTSLAAVHSRQCSCGIPIGTSGFLCHPIRDMTVQMNAGVLLFKPSLDTYEMLMSKRNGDYDRYWAEQGMLNSVYPPGKYLELPVEYNFEAWQKG